MDELFQLHLQRIALVEIDKALCPILLADVGPLLWRDPKNSDVSRWIRVKGLKLNQVVVNQPYRVANTGGGRLQVFFKSVVACRKGRRRRRTNEFKTRILCTQVSFERREFGELWAFVEWSKTVFTFNGCDSPLHLFLHSAIVTL
ncbi:PREDICTED: putative F-box/kelch-repeat protein At5g02980 [Camelina sativa]|uniref:F-box/kelch-repeat protein At5g02980 n=1 Tax=Camelina sativa TaxID=90675 RepID=A0ABM1RE50_CAMSA|nr:PREDICTED: putative F-box/kelch-repeat protein At5g02980 [Camelina sativa]